MTRSGIGYSSYWLFSRYWWPIPIDNEAYIYMAIRIVCVLANVNEEMTKVCIVVNIVE